MSACKSTNAAGRPCSVRALRGKSYCFNHSPEPEVKEQRRRAREAGGRARGTQLRRRGRSEQSSEPTPEWWALRSIADARAGFAWVFQGLAVGQLEARTAHGLIAALNGIAHLIRDEDLELRLGEVEAELGLRERADA